MAELEYEYGGSQRLAGLAAVVNGSSWGIGRAVALAFSREGASVLCTDSSPSPPSPLPEGASSSDDTIKPTHEEILGVAQGERAAFYYADPRNCEQINASVAKCVELFGRLDIIVNNAAWGSTPGKAILDEKVEDFDDNIAVNIRSVWAGTKYAIQQMISQEKLSPMSRGKVINISSIGANVAIENSPSYCATKAAVVGLTRQVAVDYAKYEINVNSICSGVGANEDGQNARTLAGPWAQKGGAIDVAMAAIFLASEESRYCTGTVLTVDGGYSAR